MLSTFGEPGALWFFKAWLSEEFNHLSKGDRILPKSNPFSFYMEFGEQMNPINQDNPCSKSVKTPDVWFQHKVALPNYTCSWTFFQALPSAHRVFVSSAIPRHHFAWSFSQTMDLLSEFTGLPVLQQMFWTVAVTYSRSTCLLVLATKSNLTASVRTVWRKGIQQKQRWVMNYFLAVDSGIQMWLDNYFPSSVDPKSQ